MKGRFFFRLLMVTLAGIALILVWRWPDLELNQSKNVPAEPRPVTARGDLAADEQATIELFESSRNSVVFISTSRRVMDYWSRDIFSVPRGNGSGFVWDKDGHIVTNFHVIDGASEAQVKLADGRSYKAVLVGASPGHDIAVLKIGVSTQYPRPVPVGQSANLKVGQKVFAIGNPFGLDWTLTTGVVSALDRSLPTEAGPTLEHLIQTDAAINPGNSGGPLLDSAGRLIGINTAIFSPSGAYAGVGFAVPVDTVNRVVPELIEHGKYVRPALGIEVDEGWNQRLARMLKTKGVVVLRVVPGSAADRAGLKGAKMSYDGGIVPGDVIVSIEGSEVTSVGELLGKIDNFSVGEQVSLGVLRNGEETQIEVTLQPGI